MATKDDVNKDPTLKTKAERERILRERNANNTKKFIEERKTLAVRQEKRREKLKNQHEMQLNNLDRYVQNVSILLISVYQEQSQKYIPSYHIFNKFYHFHILKMKEMVRKSSFKHFLSQFNILAL